MLVQVEIPIELRQYIEYIPTEDLPEVLLAALRDKISDTVPKYKSTDSNTVQELINMLRVMNQPSMGPAIKSDAVIAEKQQPVVKFEKVQEVALDEDDIEGFMDLMK